MNLPIAGETQPDSNGNRRNALSIDVEDYFHVYAFADQIAPSTWDDRPQRLEFSMARVLDLLSENQTHATFFFLGWVAERHPDLVKRIAEGGHEVASHGYNHDRLSKFTPERFRDDVVRTKLLLEDIAGVRVLGYRAPNFSISPEVPWAFDILGEVGYRYSSSVYPINHDHYGLPEAPRYPYRPNGAAGLLEIPVSTLRIFGRNLPSGGGGYFRLVPYRLSRWALTRGLARDQYPRVFFFHPWELDPDQPRVRRLSLKARFRHYVNLSRMEGRLRRLLVDFSWDRLDRVFAAELQETHPGGSWAISA